MQVLDTKRLLLRPYCDGDREDYISIITDPEVMEHLEGGAVSMDVAEEWWDRLINRLYPSGYRWCATLKSTGEYAGHAMLNYSRPNNECELGYILPKSVWGNGYATEISKALARYSQEELKLQRVFGTVDEGFTASINVLKKTGMRFYGYDYDEAGRFLVFSLDFEG